MDPLSISASTAALAGFIGPVAKGVRRLARLKHAKPLPQQLHNKLSDLQFVVGKLDDICRQALIKNCDLAPDREVLSRAIDRTKDAILELDKMIEYGLLAPSEGTTVKIDQLFWILKESEIRDKRDRLRDAKWDPSLAMGLDMMQSQTAQLQLVQLQASNQLMLSRQQTLENIIDSRLPQRQRPPLLPSRATDQCENDLQQQKASPLDLPTEADPSPSSAQAIIFRVASSKTSGYLYFWHPVLGGAQLQPKDQRDIFGLELELDHFQFTPLHAAVLNLGPNGATPEEVICTTPRELINELDQLGRSALSWACAKGDLHKTGELLKMGADPNIADSEGRTSLHHLAHSALFANKRCLDELLDHGADLNIRNRRGGTPLHDFTFSSTCTSSSIEKFYLKGADLNAQDGNGWTPLHWAVRNGNIEVIDKLVQHGADIETQSNAGLTPLTYALVRHQFATFRYLLELGCHHTVRTRFGSTLLHFSARDGDIDTQRELEQRNLRGINPDDRDEDGLTAPERAERRRDGVYE
ncbi:MAG: hypothetical protein Q9187_007287 [Circinaria calcarea]